MIDIGAAAIDRGDSFVPEYTGIALDNPANASGKITSVEIWAKTDLTGCKVGTFYKDGTSFTCRDYATIGGVASGSKQTFSGLDIDVETGDYIGIYFSAGSLEMDLSGGAGMYYKSGDQFDAGTQTYELWDVVIYSLYGEGEEPPVAGRSFGYIMG